MIWGLSVDPDGNLLVSGFRGGRVTIIAPNGEVIGILDPLRAELTGPVFAVTGLDGRIYVAEEWASEISIYTPGAVAPVASPDATPVASPEA